MSGVPITVDEKRFLRLFNENGFRRLEPKVTPDGIIYKNLDPSEFSWNQILFLLKSLASKDFLEEEDFDRAIFCPTCNSPHVYSKYTCPIDKSIFVRKVTLLQHTTDGYQGEKTLFTKNDRLICPKCGDDLGDANDRGSYDLTLKEIGFSYECTKNGHKFERPYVIHFCPECGSMFDYKTAHYVPLLAYNITSQALNLLREDVDIEKKLQPMYQYLGSKGFTVSYDYEVTGVSGSKHAFDLLAENAKTKIVIDINMGDNLKLVSLLGKKMDIPGHQAVLIDFTENNEVLNLGKVYNIPVLRVNGEEWKTKLDSLIIESNDTDPKKITRRGLWGRKNE